MGTNWIDFLAEANRVLKPKWVLRPVLVRELFGLIIWQRNSQNRRGEESHSGVREVCRICV